MIKPRSQPSHFELKAEGQPWKHEGMYQQHSSDSFTLSNVESNLSVTPMGSVTPPKISDRGSKTASLSDPISSTVEPSTTSIMRGGRMVQFMISLLADTPQLGAARYILVMAPKL